jgi:hypothetical protein
VEKFAAETWSARNITILSFFACHLKVDRLNRAHAKDDLIAIYRRARRGSIDPGFLRRVRRRATHVWASCDLWREAGPVGARAHKTRVNQFDFEEIDAYLHPVGRS